MASIERHIRVDAPPAVVRRHLADPGRRRAWLGDEVEATPVPDGVRYHRGAGEDRTRVDITVVPDADGSRVTVTERPAPASAPQARLGLVLLPAPGPQVGPAPATDERGAAEPARDLAHRRHWPIHVQARAA